MKDYFKIFLNYLFPSIIQMRRLRMNRHALWFLCFFVCMFFFLAISSVCPFSICFNLFSYLYLCCYLHFVFNPFINFSASFFSFFHHYNCISVSLFLFFPFLCFFFLFLICSNKFVSFHQKLFSCWRRSLACYRWERNVCEKMSKKCFNWKK